MTLLDRFQFRKKNKHFKETPLASYFHDLEGEDDFPFNLGIEAYNKLRASAQNREELLHFLLEDSIFTSVYATFYEQLLTTIFSHPRQAIPLIETFSQDGEKRDQTIAEICEDHFRYVTNRGVCPGCKNCEHHLDVAELIPNWIERDLNFFASLYIGMQTIQFSMEHLIYDVIPANPDAIQYLSGDNILKFRQYIFEYCEDRI